VSGIPNEIPNLGSIEQMPRQNPSFAPDAGFTSEDYYVWTRCDGHTSLKEIILMVGLGLDRGVEILGKLRRIGAILFEGETPESVARRPSAPSRGEAIGEKRSRPPTPALGTAPASTEPEIGPFSDLSIDLGELSAEEAAAMSEEVSLSDPEKRRIIAVLRQLRGADLYRILGVERDADKRTIKRSYFRLSKEFHPDRRYGQNLGSFGGFLSKIFETATRAFDTLGDSRLRQQYDAALSGAPAARAPRAQTREEHAATLFDQACELEVNGLLDQAVTLFAAVCKQDPRAKYLRRAALCFRTAGKLSDAEEYAKKAADLRPNDPSYARVLAAVFRASDKLDEAEAILERTLNLDIESDIVMGELRRDLEAVRRALGKQ
jgi:hypothetical protein